MHRPGVELALFRSLVRRPSTTLPNHPNGEGVRIGHSRLTHLYLLNRTNQPQCSHGDCMYIPSHPLPSLPLEVGPLNTARESAGSDVSSPAGSGAEPQRKASLVHFRLKNLTFNGTSFTNFPEN